MKTPNECLAAQVKKHSLSTPKNIEELDKFLPAIYDAMEYFAEHAVNEQREIMARHLNLRNVPRPKISETS